MLSNLNSKLSVSLIHSSWKLRRFQSKIFMERVVEEEVGARWAGRLRGVKEEKERAAAVATRADRTTRRTMVAL